MIAMAPLSEMLLILRFYLFIRCVTRILGEHDETLNYNFMSDYVIREPKVCNGSLNLFIISDLNPPMVNL